MKKYAILACLALLSACDPQNTSSAAAPSGNGQQTAAAEAPPPGAKISLARNFYVVFDDSGSMDGGYGQTNRMKAAQVAVETFALNAPADANLGLYYLNIGEAVTLGPNNRQQFVQSVREARSRGGTPLGKSIHDGVDKLVAQRKMQLGYGEFRLVVVTDGESGDDLNFGVDYAKAQKIPIYTIGVATGRHSLADSSLSFVEAKDPAQLKSAMLETLAEAASFDAADFHK